MPDRPPFTGIPFAALDFYEDLGYDNSRPFFREHKHVYDASVRAPMEALAAELAEEFGTAKVYRPYRDLRFTKDKTPYKTHQGAAVLTAPGTGYSVTIDAAGLRAAGGSYALSREQLAHLRRTIADETRGGELESIVERLAADGYAIGGKRLKTHPRDWPADHPRIALLRHTSLIAGVEFGCPAWVETPTAADRVREAWRAMAPLVEWLTQVVSVLPE